MSGTWIAGLSASDVAQESIERPRHLPELERVHEQRCIADLPPAAAAHEAAELLLGAPALPPRLLLKRAERAEISLRLDDPFDRVGPQRADQLVLEVGDADVEPELFHLVARQIRPETGPLERTSALRLHPAVPQPGHR